MTHKGETKRAKSQSRTHNQVLGAWGERQAAGWYRQRGYQLLDKNWRCRDGELDLILSKGKDLVFCEVKTRSTLRFGHPAEHLDAAKKSRIRRLAMQWMQAHNTRGHVRFDVAAVCGPDIDVCKDAF